MADLSLWLDYYDDIYSDFDSRHYLNRRISDDFLFELKNGLKYKKERVQDLFLLLPNQARNEQSEEIITNSLKAFFHDQRRINNDKCRRKLHRGLALGITGFIIMLLNAFIDLKSNQSFLYAALRVVLEPGGWFLLWASFDFLFYDWKELKKERDFFEELSELNIHFKSS